MLPLRVRLNQMLETAASDPGVLRRLVTLATAVAVVAGLVVVDGVSLSLRIGGSAGSTETLVGVDGDGDAGFAAGGSGTSATPGGGSTGRTRSSPTSAGSTQTTSARGGAAADAPAGGRAAGAGPAAPGANGPASEAACDGPLAATDNGVTEDEVKIALLTVDLARLEALGFGVSSGSTDFPRIMDAWTAHLNARGGVACREVTYIHVETDLDVDQQVAACKRLTQDEKVFAVLAPGGLVAGAPCIAKDNRTPLVTALAAPDRWGREGAPYLWDVLMSQERILRNHVQWLVDAGEISAAKSHVGVVYANEPYGGPSVEAAMIPEFKRHGIRVRTAKLPFDFEQAAAQMPQVVLDFQTAGVNHVVMPTNIIYKTQFMQQAEQQNYFPDYSEDEATIGCQDAVTGTYPERSWNGTKCVSTGLLNGAPNGLTRKALHEYFAGHPFAQLADEAYLATNPDGYDAGGESDEDDTFAQRNAHYLVGSLISLWAQAADRAGPDLTRPAWGAAMGATGSFDRTVNPHPYSYGPEKHSGPDHVQIVQWHATAGQGYEERVYRRLTDFFRAPF